MSCIVYQVDHKTGIKYAYESVSYWDKDKQQPRSKRKYLGKVDPETGEIITKKERAVHSADNGSVQEADLIAGLKETIENKNAEIESLKNDLNEIRQKYEKLLKNIKKIEKITAESLS